MTTKDASDLNKMATPTTGTTRRRQPRWSFSSTLSMEVEGSEPLAETTSPMTRSLILSEPSLLSVEHQPLPPHRRRRACDRDTLAASSDVVQALFGADAGPCWGDFFCTHGRIRGRLYAVTDGVLFYSNLLGFERRLCLHFVDIVSISLHRTTSIRVEIADYGSDAYVFRSFHSREQVLQLLLGLKHLVDKKKNRQGAHITSRSEGHETAMYSQWEEGQLERNKHRDDYGYDDESNLTSPELQASISSSNFQLPPMPAPTNRRRAVSDSMVRFLGLQEDRPEFAVNDVFLPSASNVDSMKEAWETASLQISSLEETGIEVNTLLAHPAAWKCRDRRIALTSLSIDSILGQSTGFASAVLVERVLSPLPARRCTEWVRQLSAGYDSRSRRVDYSMDPSKWRE